MGPKRI